MDIRIEVVDPHNCARTAADILNEAWKPPCLHYSTSYISWQFGFPAVRPVRVVMAFVDDRPVGVAAVTPRQVMYGTQTFVAYILSFVAVVPAARGSGLGAALYDRLLDTVGREVPVIAFTEADSPGEKLLRDAFARASFSHKPLGSCRSIGYVASLPGAPTGASVISTDSYDAFMSARLPPPDSSTIWNCPSIEQWQHYRSDPRGRQLLVVRNPEGSSIGSAMVVTAEISSHHGIQRVWMLESVSVGQEAPEALAAIVQFAAASDRTISPSIVASNLSYLNAGTIRKSGGRAIPAGFNAHVFTKDGHPVGMAETLNLEVT